MENISLFDSVKNELSVTRTNVPKEMGDKMNKMMETTNLDYFFASEEVCCCFLIDIGIL